MAKLCLSENLKALREKRQLTQRQLAAITGVPFETISRVENGHQSASIRTVCRLADALYVSLDELVRGTPHATPYHR